MKARHRLLLERDLANLVGRGAMGFVMLNPSTADEDVDDPTIRRCKSFARREGAARLVVANLFSERATAPVDLLGYGVGPEPSSTVELSWRAVLYSRWIVVAWGAHTGSLGKLVAARARAFVGLARKVGRRDELMCLGYSKNGHHPRHPLFMPVEAALQVYSGGGR